MLDGSIGASPEVARDMMITNRNKYIANLINDSFFESEIKSFRLSLIEQRNNFHLTYGSATRDDLLHIILVLLNRTEVFLKLFPCGSSALREVPNYTVKEEVGIITSVPFVPGEKNTCRDGVHGTYIMEHNFGRNRAQKIIKGDPRIDPTSGG